MLMREDWVDAHTIRKSAKNKKKPKKPKKINKRLYLKILTQNSFPHAKYSDDCHFWIYLFIVRMLNKCN